MAFDFPQFTEPTPIDGKRSWTARYVSYDQRNEDVYYFVTVREGDHEVAQFMPDHSRVMWEEGTRIWIMNERDQWVQWQRQLSLPTGAGPSGTTNCLMLAGKALHVDATAVRAACIAHLLPAHHHTLVEILAAAGSLGCSYTPGQKMYRSIRPFSEAELRACGKDNKFPDPG